MVSEGRAHGGCVVDTSVCGHGCQRMQAVGGGMEGGRGKGERGQRSSERIVCCSDAGRLGVGAAGTTRPIGRGRGRADGIGWGRRLTCNGWMYMGTYSIVYIIELRSRSSVPAGQARRARQGREVWARTGRGGEGATLAGWRAGGLRAQVRLHKRHGDAAAS